MVIDPLAGSSWSTPGTVEGFRTGDPNAELMRFAAQELARVPGGTVVDIGCGAGRNAVPLAEMGWDVVGTDLSWPMLCGAANRARDAVRIRLQLALAPMERLPIIDGGADLVIAHGIWNLARTAAEFRAAVDEAARVAKPGAGLFVFTFSRHTLPPEVEPLRDEVFVYTEFSGAPQCFLTERQLLDELARGGFVQEAGVPVREYNRAQRGTLRGGWAPVTYEGIFRRVSPSSPALRRT
jgi:SAM-dependent methyltransferase